MAERDLEASDPAVDQPTKADTEQGVSIAAEPEARAWAVTRSGSERPDGDEDS